MIKPREYDWLFVSDVHLGVDDNVRENNSELLPEALETLLKLGITTKSFVLIGDFFENWFISSEEYLDTEQGKIKIERTFQLAKLLSINGKIIYIPGNHDSNSITLKLPVKIRKYLESKEVTIQKRIITDKIVVAHGHQGNYSKFTWAVSVKIIRLVNWICKLFPNTLNKLEHWSNTFFDFNPNITTKSEISFYKKLGKRLKQENRLMIVGHTHLPKVIPKLNSVNVGDWVRNKTICLGLESDNRINISCISYNELSKEFSFNYISTFNIE